MHDGGCAKTGELFPRVVILILVQSRSRLLLSSVHDVSCEHVTYNSITTHILERASDGSAAVNRSNYRLGASIELRVGSLQPSGLADRTARAP